MPAFDVFSIGHLNIPEERFLALLRDADVNLVADVRTVPYSRFFPWFSQKKLAASLSAAAIGDAVMGDALGGRPRDDTPYPTASPTTKPWRRGPNIMPAWTACSTQRRSRGFVSCAPNVSRWTATAVSWWRGASPSADLPSAISAMTARLSRTRRRNNGCWCSAAKAMGRAATCSRLDSRSDSAAAYRRRAHAFAFRRKTPTPRAVLEPH